MAQSRNPSERNKVGQKKKSKSWTDIIKDVAVGTIGAGIDNVQKVGEFGGNLVKGAIVDPLMWAKDNPAEVGKTFINPERASTWLVDNLFAGQELERLAAGKAGNEDAVVAAMAMLPIGGNIADDITRAALSGEGRLTAKQVGKSFAQKANATSLTDAEIDELAKQVMRINPLLYGWDDASARQMVIDVLGEDKLVKPTASGAASQVGKEAEDAIAAAQELFSGRGKNPYSAMLSGVRGELKAKRNVASAAEGVRAGRAAETPVGKPLLDENELDALLRDYLGDKDILELGATQYLPRLQGLKQRIATNEGRMAKASSPMKILEDLLQSQNLSKQDALTVRMALKRMREADVALQKKAVKAENRFSR
jgi:hypothetical protein